MGSPEAAYLHREASSLGDWGCTDFYGTSADNALIQGLFRTVRRERPDAQLTILDIESAMSPATDRAIKQVLRKLQSGMGAETEYTERNGVLLIERAMLNIALNSFKATESGKGLEAVVKNLYDAEL